MTALTQHLPESLRPSTRQLIVAGLVLAVFVALTFLSPNFLSKNNLLNILSQTAILSCLAAGMAVVLIGGGIDLSLPFNAALSAVLGAMYMRATGDPIGGMAIMILSGIGIGAFNGLAVGVLGMIPFVVTLAMMTITNGVAVWLTNSLSISQIPDAFVDPFFTRYAGLPLNVHIAIVVSLVAAFVIGRTIFGSRLYAVGINTDAARVAGINVGGVLMLSYVMAGVLAGIAAIMMTGRLASASANLASPILVLDVISACIVGGISIYGGQGRVLGAVFGAFFMTLLNNVLNALEVSLFVNQIARGGIIVAFIAFDQMAARARA